MLSLKEITELASGKLDLNTALNKFLLPALKKAGQKTAILKVVSIGTEPYGEIKDEYWTENFDDKMTMMQESSIFLATINAEKQERIDALEAELRLVINKYNKLQKSKSKK